MPADHQNKFVFDEHRSIWNRPIPEVLVFDFLYNSITLLLLVVQEDEPKRQHVPLKTAVLPFLTCAVRDNFVRQMYVSDGS